MLHKEPNHRVAKFNKALKWFLVVEGAILGSGWLFLAACNRSQETRQFLYSFSLGYHLLDFYYDLAEKSGNNQVRAFDQATWKAQNILREKEIELPSRDAKKLPKFTFD